MRGDIFGVMPGDLVHYRDLAEKGQLESHLLRKGSKHNFRALENLVTKAEGNAQAVGFVRDNLDALNAQIDEIMYINFRLNEFIPMHTGVPEGVKTYSYQVMDRVGRGAFIDQPGSMPQNARVGLRDVTYDLHYAGIVPEWNIEDVRLAMTTGVSLSTETIKAATEGCMDHIELVGLTGDTERGLKGLTNLDAGTSPTHGQVTLVQRQDSDKQISEMTGKEMAEFIQAEVVKFITETNEVFGRRIKSPLCVYLPIEECALITEAQLDLIHTDVTAWDYASSHNAWAHYTNTKLQLKWLPELKTAGTNGTNNANNERKRMIIAINTRDIMEMAMPFAPRALTVQDMGYSMRAPMEYKISGLNVKRPAGIRYIDNV